MPFQGMVLLRGCISRKGIEKNNGRNQRKYSHPSFNFGIGYRFSDKSTHEESMNDFKYTRRSPSLDKFLPIRKSTRRLKKFKFVSRILSEYAGAIEAAI